MAKHHYYNVAAILSLGLLVSATNRAAMADEPGADDGPYRVWIDSDTVLDALAHRPPMQHVIVTGRGASDALIELADTVSIIADEKHAYRAGIKAQPGIDL